MSAEQLVRDYLRGDDTLMALLTDDERRLNMEWSGDARASRVTLYRGGGRLNGYVPLDYPVVTLHCWGSTRSAASALAERVAVLMNDIDNRLTPLVSGEVESVTYLPTMDGVPRYIVTTSVTMLVDLAV